MLGVLRGRIERVRADKERLEQNQRLSQMEEETKAEILAAAQRRSALRDTGDLTGFLEMECLCKEGEVADSALLSRGLLPISIALWASNSAVVIHSGKASWTKPCLWVHLVECGETCSRGRASRESPYAAGVSGSSGSLRGGMGIFGRTGGI
jgi:hypothetical protein